MRRICSIWVLACVALTGCGKHKAAKHGGESLANVSEGSRCIDRARSARKPPIDAPERIDVGQILVRHAGVRDAKGATRTREEACLRAEEAREKLLAGGDWDTVFNEYSDAQGATQGVLYDVTQGSLEPAFADAAFSLQVDELSYVVETKRGFHIIWRKK
jgi:hypothetical protein